MTDEFLKADINGDGVISPEEFQLEIRRKRLEIEDADAQRDQGMLGYPFFVILASVLTLDKAADILGSMATIYFPATSLILASFFGAAAYQARKDK
jgi:hypothetical protein